MSELKDFGQKIGGARKDLWKTRGLISLDMDDMTDMERSSHIKKDNIWLKPDWVKEIAAGTPQGVAYWQNKMRASIPPRPSSNDELAQKNYINTVCAIRDAVMAVREPSEINSFYQSYLRPTFVQPKESSHYVTIIPEANDVITNKVLRAAQNSYRRMEQEAKAKLFGIAKDLKEYTATKNSLHIHQYDNDRVKIEPHSEDPPMKRLSISSSFGRSFYYLYEKDPFFQAEWEPGTYFVFNENTRKIVAHNLPGREDAEAWVEKTAEEAQKEADGERNSGSKKGAKRKTAFVPPQLTHIHRKGPNYRHLRHADGQMFLDDLKFRGGEFGNWLNENDRQTSLDMAYDALRDLARVLNISPEDISLNGSLAIAFGARGRGGANAGAAHYEPDRQVINLTKMSGAGCLAHEWGHALDHAIGIHSSVVGLATEVKGGSYPESFRTLIHSMKYKETTAVEGEFATECMDKISHSKRNLSTWIHSVKPRDLSPEMDAAWEQAAGAIEENASSYTGGEYLKLKRNDTNVQTIPEVEILSQIRKETTNHVIPLDAKRQIAMWAHTLSDYEKQLAALDIRPKVVKTDFYNGSIHFDKIHSRASHGYYQSGCEMFARAFDCYIADKIAESGCQSDYLTAYANCFRIKDKEGKVISAIPQGEERQTINRNFDHLMGELKELGLLHDYEETLEESRETPDLPHKTAAAERISAKRTEQLSFEQMLSQAEKERSQHVAQRVPNKDQNGPIR